MVKRRRREEVAQQCQEIELRLAKRRWQHEDDIATRENKQHLEVCVCLRVLEQGDASFIRAVHTSPEAVQVECCVQVADDTEGSSGKVSHKDGLESKHEGSASSVSGDASTIHIQWSKMTVLVRASDG
jgi:hypothetical protein